MKPKRRLSKKDKSLLLYLETCAVDHGGLVDSCRINWDDRISAERWNEAKFVLFGRVYSKDAQRLCEGRTRTGRWTYWCELSPDAWQIAHQERMARALRMSKTRTWLKTSEK